MHIFNITVVILAQDNREMTNNKQQLHGLMFLANRLIVLTSLNTDRGLLADRENASCQRDKIKGREKLQATKPNYLKMQNPAPQL